MIALLLDVLATYRVTKLVVDDQLTAEWRDKLIEAAYVDAGKCEQAKGVMDDNPGAWADHVAQDPDPPKLAYLVTCPWCSGMYVSLAVVAARRIAPRAWSSLARALALSAAAGLIAENLQQS